MLEKFPSIAAPDAPNTELTIVDTSDLTRGTGLAAGCSGFVASEVPVTLLVYGMVLIGGVRTWVETERDEIAQSTPYVFEKRFRASDARVALRVGDKVPQKFAMSVRVFD